MTLFLRLLEAETDQKGATLAVAADRWRAGDDPGGIFRVEPSRFEQVPGSPFAYWVSERVLDLFTASETFGHSDRTARQGLATTDDNRFVRLWWEVSEASNSGTWKPFAKGGRGLAFYAEISTCVNWAGDGAEMKAKVSAGGDHWSRRIPSTEFYFRPGLTYPRRASALYPQAMPRGTIISVRGSGIYTGGNEAEWLGLLSSKPFDVLVKLMLGREGHPQFDNGTIERTPIPSTQRVEESELGKHARRAWGLRRDQESATMHSRTFTLPPILQVGGKSLRARADAWATEVSRVEEELEEVQEAIDNLGFELYGISGEDRRQMEEGFAGLGSSEDEAAAGEDEDADEEVEGADPVAVTEALLEWALGTALGRFDVRLATGEREPSPASGPFDPLPVCSPGMLQGEDALPTHEVPAEYPLDLPTHGILVDDPGHPWDVVARVEAVFDVLVDDRGHGWTAEAEEILGRDLRDWLRRYGFERHVKRYSRSRRKAPLFWHLAPNSREYGIWLYSPVATKDTFFRILNDYLDPKLKTAERELLELKQHSGGSPTGQQRKELNAQESLVEDLRGFREQVALVAPLWKPHRDDGVVLNCALLSRLFDHHRTWQKECEKRWDELAEGKYDWAGWSMHLWPERVVRSCASDRSIAIAHGLEEALWEEDEDGNWVPRADAEEQVATLVAERRSPAVESALEAYGRAG